MWYCSGVSVFFHSASVFSIFSLILFLIFECNERYGNQPPTAWIGSI